MKSTKKNIKIAVVLLLAIIMLMGIFSGCQKKTEEPKEKDKITIGLVVGYRRDEYYMDLESRFRQLAAENGWDLFAVDVDFDVPRHVAAIEDYTAKGVDAIISNGTASIVSAVEAAVDAGIPVVCYDGSCPSDKVTANVTYDPIADGKAVGEWAKAYIAEHWPNEEVEVAILDYPKSAEICVGRTNAFKAVIETIPNAKIVAQMDGNASRADSMAAAETILEANPNIKLAYGINFDTIAGFYAALEGRNKTDTVLCSSGSWGEEAINFLVEDHAQYKAFTLMNPWAQAEAAVQAVKDELANKEVKYDQEMQAVTYTAENIGELDWKHIIENRNK
ncbi:MAG: sugar ABC transporter substrate-binding protein [Clostridiaceae bacterium]|nr:sugar ABC transporter substrate-binding protein [Clostridiaceae bacterium]